MIYQLHQCCIKGDRSIVDAMQSLDVTGVEIVLVVDPDERLLGVLTDGDIRRALLQGATLQSPVAPYVQRRYTSVSPSVSRAEVLDLMRARTLEQIPVVDAAGHVAGLHLLHEVIGAIERPNWAVIMAGGKGTRLRPITENIPKPMLRVAGRPILERLVLHLVGFGIRRVFLSINYLGHIVEEHFGDGSQFGCEISYLRESCPLGTGGALSLLPDAPVAPLIVLNGDVVTQADVGTMLGFHAAGGFAATLGVKQYGHTVPFGCVTVDGDRVVQFEEKPLLSRLINTGLYVLGPQLLPEIPRGIEFPITRLLEQCIRNGQPVGAYEVADDWIDVGQRDQLRLAREGGA